MRGGLTARVDLLTAKLGQLKIATPRLSPLDPSAGSQTTSEPVHLAFPGPGPVLNECSELVRGTILNARAPSTRAQYANRWKLFSAWCADKHFDPVLLDDGHSHSTLNVCVAGISSHHVLVDNGTLGSHGLVSLFLRGALRSHPLCQLPVEPLFPALLMVQCLAA